MTIKNELITEKKKRLDKVKAELENLEVARYETDKVLSDTLTSIDQATDVLEEIANTGKTLKTTYRVMPEPKADESQDEFIERCMSDETMKDEYKDNDQRLAICFSQWKKEKKEANMKSGQIETRTFPVEMRVEGDDKPKIRGVAAVFNKLSDDLGGYRERIMPGAFQKAIEKSDVRALWNHDSNIVLGRTKSGTLTLEEEDEGLAVMIDPPSWAGPHLETIKRGDVSEMSFAFTVSDKGEEWDNDKHIRTIIEFNRIYDVSPVTYPAYPQTNVKVRMDDADKEDIVSRIIRGTQPEAEEPVIQGADDKERGRVDSLDIMKRRLELANSQ